MAVGDPSWWFEKIAAPAVSFILGAGLVAWRIGGQVAAHKRSVNDTLQIALQKVADRFNEMRLNMAQGLELEVQTIKIHVDRNKEDAIKRLDAVESGHDRLTGKVTRWMSGTRHALGRIEGAMGLGSHREPSQSRPDLNRP